MSQEFDAVVDRCQRSVFSYASYFLHDRGAAEDLTQEVFLKLWRHWETVDFDRVEAWLMRVTRNACYDKLRLERSAGKHLTALPEGALEAKPDLQPGPGERAEAGDVRRLLRQGLAQLAEPLRSVLILREVLGYKYEEMAETLEIPLNTVRVYLHRGRKKMREQLAEVYLNDA
jgi:RNA polymerase sigma-70 factor (ECF subfamily)